MQNETPEYVKECAQRAVNYDHARRHDAAVYFYLEAARVILNLVDKGVLPAQQKVTAQKYVDRADVLNNEHDKAVSTSTKTEHQMNVERADFLLNEALSTDEAGQQREALELYAQAVETCLKCANSATSEPEKLKYRTFAERSLERAEAIKTSIDALPAFPEVPSHELAVNLSREDTSLTPSASKAPVPRQKLPKAAPSLSADETRVLAATSKINGRSYVPFLPHDLNERFAYPIPFTDSDGLLALADKQKKRLKDWMRPDEFMPAPKMIEKIDSGTIKQTVVSDCSFVASLAIAARYERRFGSRLITNIIYPQNKNGEPVFNPCGKYMIKFHINGILRKVVIDDRLPIGQHGELLCSYRQNRPRFYSQNKNELWVSLLEKAYMKVMGGYDFPGSNSNIDLHALTGWIPERIPIRSKNADLDKIFERLFARFHQGHCLITLATPKMEQSEQDRTGLVDAHAYAVLDLRKITIADQNKRLLLVKNPWTHLRWKGRFSEKDLGSWTPELRKALDYNPEDAQQFDDGVFWIDYESVCAFFDVIYVNWDPALFPFSYALHASWSAGVGPVKDLYSIAENPQYYLKVNNRHGKASVWILLSRHITDKADFADNKEYITLLVYKSGKKIYYPCDPKPIIEDARINSPHYLCQLVVEDPGMQKYTLVVAQYEKSTTIHYTLRVYSSTDFECDKVKVPYKTNKKEAGEWKGKTAAGCSNGPSVGENPLYHISLDDGSDENALLVDLRGPKQFSVGVDLWQVSSFRNKPFEKKDSGAFRPGYTIMQADKVPAGTYALRPMTFLPGQEGPFILRVDSSCGFKLKRVQ